MKFISIFYLVVCIGVVITFVGLGEKGSQILHVSILKVSAFWKYEFMSYLSGFKTVELKMIGPILCVIGLTCITIKIIHCSFPQMFKVPAFLK